MPQKWKVKTASRTGRGMFLETSSGVLPQRKIGRGGSGRVLRLTGGWLRGGFGRRIRGMLGFILLADS